MTNFFEKAVDYIDAAEDVKTLMDMLKEEAYIEEGMKLPSDLRDELVLVWQNKFYDLTGEK